jgi:phosphatidylglycerophosphatase A
MNNFPNLKKPTHIIATLGGIGNAKYAPGTWGSLAALLLFIFISHQSINIEILIIGITFYAIYISGIVSEDLIEKDHKAIVIDELAGMWIAAYPAIYYSSQNERVTFVVLAFILFRIFDITKPYPISYIDKNIKGGLGIVLDDVVAGFIAAAMTIGLMNLIFG